MTKKFFCTAAHSGIAGRSVPAGGLALPVCAAGADDALSAQNVETMQQENAPTAETLTGEQTDEDKTAPDGAAAATPHADGNAHPDPHANGDTHRDPDPPADGDPHPETDAHRDADTG